MNKKRKDNFDDNLDISTLKFYYGIPHCHTELSNGTSKPSDALDYAKSIGLDYIIITDHNTKLNIPSGDKEESSSKWQSILKSVYKFNKKNEDFVAIHGFETNTSTLGHINIINTKSYFTGTVTNFKSLLLWMLPNEDCFISINHPNKSIDKLKYNKELNTFINTIEIDNSPTSNKSTGYENQFFSLLDKGWKLGAINSQDNHIIDSGNCDNVTGTICNTLDKSSIINAFINRHTYSTESRTLKLFFTINSIFMGGTVSSSDFLDFYIYAEDEKYKINKIQIITNGGKITKEIDNINLHRIKYLFKKDVCFKESWYIIKVFLSNKKMAISSPIFLSNS